MLPNLVNTETRRILENALGFHEKSNIHRRFTELCIETLSFFNTVTILTGVWLMY